MKLSEKMITKLKAGINERKEAIKIWSDIASFLENYIATNSITYEDNANTLQEYLEEFSMAVQRDKADIIGMEKLIKKGVQNEE
jgi:hypothetical protein